MIFYFILFFFLVQIELVCLRALNEHARLKLILL